MNKYERWRQRSEEYFKTVTKEQLIKDSAKVGIILTPIRERAMSHGYAVARGFRKAKSLRGDSAIKIGTQALLKHHR